MRTIIDRARAWSIRWWDGWVTRDLKETRPGGFPQAVYEVRWRHPRTLSVILRHRDPMERIHRHCGDRERAFRRRDYKGRW